MKSRQRAVIVILAGIFMVFSLSALPSVASISPVDDEGLSELYSIELSKNEAAFMFLGFSGVIIRTGGDTIIIDPAGGITSEDLDAIEQGGVDLLLYTHGHGDHFVPRIAKAIFRAANPIVAANPALTPDLSDEIPSDKLKKIMAGESYHFGDIELDVIEGIHVGYITLFRVTIGEMRIFHGGDSAYVPLKKFPSDLAFLPTGNPSPTASPKDAFRMASDLKPSVAVAIHGSSAQNKEFRNLIGAEFPKTTVIVAKKRVVQKIKLK